jgi:CDP-paratose 2-epimerase
MTRSSEMRILITGASGFVGATLACALRADGVASSLHGVDNLSRAGSEHHRRRLQRMGIPVIHGDLRCQSDVDALPAVDWIIDCAANPSVLAGADGRTTSRQLIEHNLLGTVNLLEKCRRDGAGFMLLSTSRVYSIPPLAGLDVAVRGDAYQPGRDGPLPPGVSAAGISEAFSTAAPVSLYGATKIASEVLALEYGETNGFPVYVNRCGVLAGAGQFGRADQGIFAFWINSHLRRRPLRYIGFDGGGHQVRDCLHPEDLVPLLRKQMAAGSDSSKPRIVNASGGMDSARSLKQLTDWCDARFGPHPVSSDPSPRRFDLPWVVLDSALARQCWEWAPARTPESIFEEIARHAEAHPDWLQLSGNP